ncbi:MAG: hypothetical protein L0Y72_20690 [Gemmataceae bacterium]|nr:hypothetical protein [Gemmataceae bacterium]MCI0741458.1 hypothetical protein [Gemmataceae bacterium]
MNPLLVLSALVFAQAPYSPVDLNDAQKAAIAAIEKLDGKVTVKDGAVVMVDL